MAACHVWLLLMVCKCSHSSLCLLRAEDLCKRQKAEAAPNGQPSVAGAELAAPAGLLTFLNLKASCTHHFFC